MFIGGDYEGHPSHKTEKCVLKSLLILLTEDSNYF